MSDTPKLAWPYPEQSIEIDGKKHYAKLWHHPNGQWCRKLGKTPHYFGSVNVAAEQALENFKKNWGKIVDGGKPPAKAIPASVNAVFGEWLNSVEAKVNRGEMSRETLKKYHWYYKLLRRHIKPERLVSKLAPEDFAKLRNAISDKSVPFQSDFIANIRGAFSWAAGEDVGVIDRPPKYGEHFVQPQRKTVRMYRHLKGSKLIPPHAVRLMIYWARIAHPQFLPVLMLGINCGMKSGEINSLRRQDIDFGRGVIETIRPKTSSEVMAPLWPETIEAIKSVARESDPILRWSDRTPWVTSGTNRVTRSFDAMRSALSLPKEWQHQWLRHTFRTVGGKNSPAVKLVMGHVEANVLDEIYNHDELVQECRDVVDRVHRWLWKP